MMKPSVRKAPFFRSLVWTLWLLATALPTQAFEFTGDYFRDGNQLLDQERVARTFGNQEDVWSVLHRLKVFKQKYPTPSHPSQALALEGAEERLHEFLRVQGGLNSAPRTEADAVRRIFQAYALSEGMSTVPQNHERSPKLIEPSARWQERLSERIAAEALLNALNTALFIRKAYQNNFSPTPEMIAAEIKILCRGSENSCGEPLREWLQFQAEIQVNTEAFKNISYRDGAQVAADLNRAFAKLNMNHVLTSKERAHANLWKRHERLSELYCSMMRAGGFVESNEYHEACLKKGVIKIPQRVLQRDGARYQHLREQYQVEQKALIADQARLQIYESVIREAIASGRGQSGDELSTEDRIEGVRYFCSQRMDLPGARVQSWKGTYEGFLNGYAQISGGPDGLLLYTQALESHRLQGDTWLNDSKKCPSEYPLTITGAQIRAAARQALEETRNASRKIFELRNSNGAGWVRYFQPAVGKALVGFPEDVEIVVGMVRALKDIEKREAVRKKLMIGASVVASLPMLVVPVAGEAGVVALTSTVVGAVSVSATIGLNGYDWWYQTGEGRNLLKSIASGNADLAGKIEEVEIRNKVGAACRQLVLDAAFTLAESLTLLRSLKVNELIVMNVQGWVVQTAKQLAREPLKTIGRAAKRVVVRKRDLNAVLPERKWGGILQEGRSWKIHEMLDLNNWFQIVPRSITRKTLGKPYEFVPVRRLDEWIERGILFRSPDLEFTTGMRFVVGGFTFPATGLGLAFMGMHKIGLDYAARHQDPSFLRQFDYRYYSGMLMAHQVREHLRTNSNYRREFQERYGMLPESESDIEELLEGQVLQSTNEQGLTLGEFIKIFQDVGFEYHHPLTLAVLRQEPAAIREMARILAAKKVTSSRDSLAGAKESEDEIHKLQTQEFENMLVEAMELLNQGVLAPARQHISKDFLSSPPENVYLPKGVTLSESQKNEIYRIHLENLLAIELIYSGKREFAPNVIREGAYLGHLKDAFITETLPQYEREGRAHPVTVLFHQCQYLSSAAELETLKVLGGTLLAYEYLPGPESPPPVRLTSEPVTLERVAREILEDVHSDSSVPNLLKKLKEVESEWPWWEKVGPNLRERIKNL